MDTPKHELRAELRARRAQILAWLMYALFGFGGLWLFSATSPDQPAEQHAFWNRIPQAEQATIGVVQVAAGVMFGVAALAAYRRDARVFAPGERRIGLQRPGRVVVVMVLAIAGIALEIAWFGGRLFQRRPAAAGRILATRATCPCAVAGQLGLGPGRHQCRSGRHGRARAGEPGGPPPPGSRWPVKDWLLGHAGTVEP